MSPRQFVDDTSSTSNLSAEQGQYHLIQGVGDSISSAIANWDLDLGDVILNSRCLHRIEPPCLGLCTKCATAQLVPSVL